MRSACRTFHGHLDRTRLQAYVRTISPSAPPVARRGGCEMKRFLAAGALVAGLVFVPASGALAGEVKGPSQFGEYNTDTTGALDHANSACAASGLNDFDPEEGQNVSRVQTAADSWKYYGLPKGAVGTFGLCRGGSAH